MFPCNSHPPISNVLEDETAMLSLHKRCSGCGEFVPSETEVWSKSLKAEPKTFVGREELLDKMNELCRPDRHNILVCHGIGGIGKSALVRQYMYTYRHCYKFIAWFDATTRDTIVNEIACLTTFKFQRVVNNSVLEFIKYLSYYKRSGWLLIFDNANGYDDVEDFVPRGNGTVIITSRTAVWPLDRAELMHVDGFSVLDCNQYICRILGESIPSTMALAEAVGRVPFFLASTISKADGETNNLPFFPTFINGETSFPRSKQEKIIISCFMQWKSTFDEIVEKHSTYRDLLTYWSLIGNETVSFAVLERCFIVAMAECNDKRDPVHRASFLASNAINCLEYFSFAKYNESDETVSIPIIILNAIFYFVTKIPEQNMFERCKSLLETLMVQPGNEQEIKAHYEMLLIRNGK
jgi:hypothetical protein